VYIPDEVAGYVRSLLLEPGAKPGDVFTTAKDLIALAIDVKSYADTRAGYKGSLYTAIAAAQADETTRRAFAATMRTLSTRFGLIAAFDGLAAGGLTVESLDSNQLKVFRDWQQETSGYITDFGAEIFRQGITENEVSARAEAWSSKTLDFIYNRMYALAAPEKRVKRQLGATDSHCPDCVYLADNKVATLKDWQASGWFVKSSKQACHGDHCDCSYVDTEDPVNFDPYKYESQGK
jgi:hypothetical protein